MYLIAFLYILSCVLYIIIGVSAIDSDSKNKQNQLFLVLCIVLASWACSLAMMNLSRDAQMAGLFRFISVAPCVIYPVLFLLFILTLTENKILDKKRAIPFIALPAVISIYLFMLVPKSETHMLPTVWGWSYAFIYENGTNWLRACFYDVYYTIYIGIALIFLYKWGVSSNVKRKKKQANVINITVIIAFLLGFFIDVILHLRGAIVLPPLTAIIIQIPMIGVLVSMKKFSLMKLSAQNISSDIFRVMNDGMIVADNNGRVMDANLGAAKLLKCPKDHLVGVTIQTFFFMATQLNEIEEISGIETELKSKNGDICTVLLSVTALKDLFNENIGYVFLFQDIRNIIHLRKELQKSNESLEKRVQLRTAQLTDSNTKLKSAIEKIKESEKQLERMAYLDLLTGLHNRNTFYLELKNGISNKNECFSVLLLDLDKFKRVNDTVGYSFGDQIIIEVGRRLQAILHEGDFIARIEGDSFALMLKNRCLFMEEDNSFLTKTMEILNKPYHVYNTDISVTASIGCDCFPMDSTDENKIMIYAEAALFQAKEEGGNRAVFFDDQIKKKVTQELQLTNDLFFALNRNELELYYQPQVDSQSERITGFEALIRWNHPVLGMINPEFFISIAEKTGLIIQLGEWVIKTACEQAKEWLNMGLSEFEIAVNISVAQFHDADFVKKVVRIINDNELPANFIVLEITESIAMIEFENVLCKLNELKDLGFRIAIDDFGSGYSSLNYIARLPVNQIKLDKRFIDNIYKNKKTEIIIQAIVKMAKKLNLNVVAEGCETIVQKEFLHNINCDSIQGYYYYMPMKATDIKIIFEQTTYLTLNDELHYL